MINAHIQSEHYKTLLTNGRHEIISDEPAAVGGSDLGMAPTELLLSSLGACTAITLRLYADRKGWPLTDVRVELSMESSKVDGQTVTGITRTIQLEGTLDEAQRNSLIEIANKCPIHRVLTGQIHIHTQEVIV